MVSNSTNVAINLEKQAISARKMPNKNYCNIPHRLRFLLIGASLYHQTIPFIYQRKTYEDEK